jgi:hypothetical protein
MVAHQSVEKNQNQGGQFTNKPSRSTGLKSMAANKKAPTGRGCLAIECDQKSNRPAM